MAAEVRKNRDKIKERRSELVKALIDYSNCEQPKHTINNHIVLNSDDKRHVVQIDETLTETVVRIKNIADLTCEDVSKIDNIELVICEFEKNEDKQKKEVEDAFKKAAQIGGAIWGKQ